MVEVIKKTKETNLSMLKRFSRKIKQSGKILHYKGSQFNQRKESELKKKLKAINRIQRKKEIDKLYKLGRIGKSSKRSR
ncbi:MAG: hypothetical protein ABII97_00090 [Patescibacteria group bacterium]